MPWRQVCCNGLHIMQLTQSMGMRTEMGMRQLLTPRMIQSMEILQLPLMALEERIEQELQNNPVLELREEDPEAEGTEEGQSQEGGEQVAEEEQALVLKEDGDAADFQRLEKFGEYLENEEFATNDSHY